MLILTPVVTTATGSWQRWLVIALIANAALVPAVFVFGGAWRRPRPSSAIPSPLPDRTVGVK